MRTRIFIPPLPRMSGGLAVLYHMAAHLAAAGHDVALVPREGGAPGLAVAAEAPGVRLATWESPDLAPGDIWLVPEGWANALTPGLKAGARCVVYVQNWAYLLSSLPEGVHWAQLPVSFLAVSQPVAWYVQQATGQDAAILRPGIDPALFHAPVRNPASGAGDVVRVAWMPRKNKALALQVRELCEARLALPRGDGATSPRLEWLEIHGRTQAEVAELLRSAHIFLASGFPEGCPLPPLEALASGCVVTGFSGFGGWDYMRQAQPGGFAPWWPLREVGWQGNGFYTADADVVAAAFALEQLAHVVAAGGSTLQAIRQAGAQTVAAYTLEQQRSALLVLWEQAAQGRLFNPR